MIEVIAGLVALMVLTAGILQVASLTMVQTETLVTARGRAGSSAMGSAPISAFPDFISDITDGDDGRSYSTDDEREAGSEVDFLGLVVDRSASSATDWDTLDAVPASPMTVLRRSGSPVAEFGLVEGTATRSVDLLPAVQRLLYDDEEITVRSRVWMTRTGGMY